MKATKTWHCSCCNETINPGDEFKIVQGSILKDGHVFSNPLDNCIGFGPGHRADRPTIKTEQLELLTVPRDYTKYKRELPEQQDIHDLPLFNSEYQKTEQLSLF